MCKTKINTYSNNECLQIHRKVKNAKETWAMDVWIGISRKANLNDKYEKNV